MNSVFISPNGRDNEMIDIFSYRKDGKTILWGTVHADIVWELSGEGNIFEKYGEPQELIIRLGLGDLK